jgi:hypothetical protein
MGKLTVTSIRLNRPGPSRSGIAARVLEPLWESTMRRGLLFAMGAGVIALALVVGPSATVAHAQPTPGTIVVQPAPGTTVVQPAPGTTIVQPAPGTTVVQPVPGTTVVQPVPPPVVVQPAPGTVVVPAGPIVEPGAPPVGTPLNCPECRGARIEGQRYLPPSVSVCIPGPPRYGPGPFLVSTYGLQSGPPYAIPTFPAPTVTLVPMPGVRPIVNVTYAAGRTSEITITAPSGQTFPADVRVQAVTDAAHQITWDVKSTSVSQDRRTLTVVVEGKGLPKSVTTPPANGNLAVTLAGPGTLPTLPPVPVMYATPR